VPEILQSIQKKIKLLLKKSTLPVRTAEKVKEILYENSTDIHFEILSNPEFLAEGTAIQD
jgi:UDPglucose 6-dehydrogenase